MTTTAFSPTGGVVATGSWDGSVRLWSVGGELRFVLRGLTEDIEGLAFSPDGARLAAVSRNSNARIFRVADGVELCAMNEHRDSVESVLWSRDGRRVITGSWDGDVRVWSGETCATVRVFHVHEEGIFALALSPAGDRLITGSQDHNAAVWDLEDGRRLRELTAHDDAVYAATWSDDGQRFATGGRDGRIFVYEDRPERMVADLRLGEPVLALRFVSADTLEAVGWSGEGRRWRVSDGAELPQEAGGRPIGRGGALQVLDR